MPWLSETTKDVVSCDKLRGAAHKHYIRRFPNGTTQHTEGVLFRCKSGSQPPELKHLSRERKRKQIVIPQVVASEKGIAQTSPACRRRVVGPQLETVIKLNFLEN